MVKLRKVKTESPASTLGVLAFNLDTSNIKVHPRELFMIIAVFVILEVLMGIFFPA